VELSPCIEWIFADQHKVMGDRVRAAKAAGYSHAEFHLWRDKDVDGSAAALAETGVKLTGVCVDPRRSLVDPSQHEEFVQAVRDSLVMAKQLGSPPLIVASGFTVEGVSKEDQVKAAISALKRAAKLAEEAGVVLILEPLNNRVEFTSMFLVETPLALDIIESVGSPNLKLLYDLYHSTVMGEDPAEVLKGRMHLVYHVQVADVPGRNEPGTGKIDWAKVMNTLREYGYKGALGLEYRPTLPSGESLAKTRRSLGL
jgi:hydroxypyruvate isomerase